MMIRALAISAAVLFSSTTAHAYCFYNCDYTKTEYPIVLAHGLSGFDEIFGVIDYWYGIPDALEDGGADVYVASVSQFNSVEARGEQLLDDVATVLAITGKSKVHLIGHSMGGLDARYVAGVAPSWVASVTTISTPHKGAELADFVRDNLEEGALGETILSTLAEFAGQLIALLSGTFNEQDGVAALEALTSAGTAEFTSEFPIGVPTSACGEGPELVNGIYYYSWSGTGVLTNALDIGDLLLGASSLVYSEANDGLVGRCSSRFGRVIRDDYFLNHLDSVNQVLGLTSWFETDPKSLIRAHVNRLKNLGL